MSTVDDLKAAKAAIEERGWVQGMFTDGTRVCAVGALNLVCTGSVANWITGDWMRRDALYGTLRAHLPEGFSRLPEFNDDPATTQQDVLDLFNKALADLGGLA